MVIAGRSLAAELVSAWSSRGSGLSRLVRAWASTLLAWLSMSGRGGRHFGGWRGSGIRIDEAFCVVHTERHVGLCRTIGCVEVLEDGVRN